jgi:Zn ribbon nucleic-acid-binding protein
MRLIDADATIKYLREFRCKDCDRRKGMKNGKIRFLYEIGDAPCRACDIGDTIDYFLDEDISTTIDAVPVVYCKDCEYHRHDDWCTELHRETKQNDYCSWGVKKDE